MMRRPFNKQIISTSCFLLFTVFSIFRTEGLPALCGFPKWSRSLLTNLMQSEYVILQGKLVKLLPPTSLSDTHRQGEILVDEVIALPPAMSQASSWKNILTKQSTIQITTLPQLFFLKETCPISWLLNKKLLWTLKPTVQPEKNYVNTFSFEMVWLPPETPVLSHSRSSQVSEKPIKSSSIGPKLESVSHDLQCDTKLCPPYAKCQRITYVSQACVCPQDCPNDHQPVCGTDQHTYESLCHMQRMSCLKNIEIKKHSDGPCDPCISVSCPFGSRCIPISADRKAPVAQCSCAHLHCQPEWPLDSVCADDGNTYDSACLLQKAACDQQTTIRILHKGSCKTNPCANLLCPRPFSRCQVDHQNNPRCICPSDCKADALQPVCGSDNVTYQSLCHIKNIACDRNSFDLMPLYMGECSNPIRCSTSCKRYELCQPPPNPVPIIPRPEKLMSRHSEKFLNSHECRCPQCPGEAGGGGVVLLSTDDITWRNYDRPVCGTDHRSYRSHCHLHRSACLQQSRSLAVLYEGPCDVCQLKQCKFHAMCQISRFGEPQCVCPTDCNYSYDPVCGSDGVTYDNLCKLKIISCAQQKEVEVVSRGVCKDCSKPCPLGQECVNGQCVCRERCPNTAFPVCGTDGKLYPNVCELKRQACLEGITVNEDLSEASCDGHFYAADSALVPAIPTGCTCNVNGSVSPFQCNPGTRQCVCKPNVMGERCDKCMEGTWGLSKGSGCTRCECHTWGSVGWKCDPITGNCQCHSGVKGKTCDECVESNYILTKEGCQAIALNVASTMNDQMNDGKTTNHPAGIYFADKSYMEILLSNVLNDYVQINLTLIPLNITGTIFYLGDFLRENYISLIFKEAFLEFRAFMGGSSLIILSEEVIKLYKPLFISAILTERQLFLWQNGRLVGTTESRTLLDFSSLATFKSAFIGQLPLRTLETKKQTAGVMQGFQGCLREFTLINGQDKYNYQLHQLALESMIRKTRAIRQLSHCPGISTSTSVHTPRSAPQFRQLDEGLISSSQQGAPHLRQLSMSPANGVVCDQQRFCKHGGTCIERFTDSRMASNRRVTSSFCACPLGRQGLYCEEEVSFIAEFHGQGMLAFQPSLLNLNQKFEMEIIFLSGDTSGLLFMISEENNGGGDHLRISYINGQLEINYQTRKKTTTLRSAGEVIKQHRWHRISFKKVKKNIVLQVDDLKAIKAKTAVRGWKRLPSNEKKELQKFRVERSNGYLGGHPGIHFGPPSPHNLWFKGAIQKFSINGVDVPLQKGVIMNMQGVPLTKNVPYQTKLEIAVTQWQGLPCLTPGPPVRSRCRAPLICQANMSQAMCVCSLDPRHSCHNNKKPVVSQFNNDYTFLSADQPLADHPNSLEASSFALLIPPEIGKRTKGPIKFFDSPRQAGVGQPIRLDHLRPNGTVSNIIRLRFRTQKHNGIQIILLSPLGNTTGDFLLMAIRDGYQETAMHLGGFRGLLRIRSPVIVADNNWHEVQVIRNLRKLTLIVDKRSIEGDVSQTADHVLHVNNSVWIGGVPQRISGFPSAYEANFHGCISDFWWNENRVEMAEMNGNPHAQFAFCDAG